MQHTANGLRTLSKAKNFLILIFFVGFLVFVGLGVFCLFVCLFLFFPLNNQCLLPVYLEIKHFMPEVF